MKKALLVMAVGAALAVGPTAAAPGWTAERHATPSATPAAPKAAHPVGEVTSNAPLHVRQKPTVYSKVVKTLRPHQRVRLNCQKRGGWVDGNPVWYRLQGVNGWVSARYVHNLQSVRPC
ncbi:SH3 domain-containing protein [Streptomyces sp. NPDC048606]|uniref:SH3 domain-containing protein n=1 Tax=Streptomyces sp. NPDC048606 TaxID=3154726 RepID=UPI003427F1DB